MDFGYTEREEAFRRELRSWLERNVPRGPRVFPSLEAEAEFLTAWQRKLHEAGWVAVHWPVEYGGRGASLTEQAIFQEEMARARAPQVMNRVGINLVGPTLIAHGTEEQKRRYLSKILSCEEVWCQLFSEPNAGSDLASLRTRAERVGDGYRVNGQKVWTSYAQFARWGILLARTDPDAPKHEGLSYLIVDMKAPGVEIRPLRQITGSAEFSETFFENVFVPRENLVGEENRGWEIAQTTLAHERGTAFPFKEQVLHRIAVDELRDLLRSTGRSKDPVLRQKLATSFIEVEIMRLHNCRTMTKLSRGEMPGPESSVVKLFWADLSQRLFETALEVLGPRGNLVHGDPRAESQGRWVHGFLWSRSASIAGGTSEIQRNIIARRILGLPRS
ncbi:MAG: acyl-CoA dehydrogenase [Candidatus Binatia bacterium]|nr:MAG: acyl-CoA dehydrogenase [Candidatus Binatia bacterium]